LYDVNEGEDEHNNIDCVYYDINEICMCIWLMKNGKMTSDRFVKNLPGDVYKAGGEKNQKSLI
jgi:hypothetical protein